MRLLLASVLLAIAASCHEAPQIDQINIRSSVEQSADIMVNNRGEGRFILMDHLRAKTGSFPFSAAQFQQLREQLEPFRRNAVPFTEASARELGMRKCPQGVPHVPGVGQVYVHWTSAELDQHYIADLGCDYERNKGRNRTLLSIVNRFPLPPKG